MRGVTTVGVVPNKGVEPRFDSVLEGSSPRSVLPAAIT